MKKNDLIALLQGIPGNQDVLIRDEKTHDFTDGVEGDNTPVDVKLVTGKIIISHTTIFNKRPKNNGNPNNPNTVTVG